MKETIEFIKNLWSNKRTRALAILIIYAIFFTFVFILIGNGKTGPREPLEEIDDPPVIEESDFDLANVTDYLIEVTGDEAFTYNSVTNLISYNGIDYELEEKPIELNNYDLDIFKPSNISELLDVAVLESTNHIENTNTYLVKISDFERIIYNNNSDVDEYIKITVYNNNEKIKIDLSNHYNYVVNMELRG